MICHVLSTPSGMKLCAKWMKTFITEMPIEFIPQPSRSGRHATRSDNQPRLCDQMHLQEANINREIRRNGAVSAFVHVISEIVQNRLARRREPVRF